MSNQESRGSDCTRRLIIQGAVASGMVAGFSFPGSSLLSAAQAADASQWLQNAFQQKTEADALKALYGKPPQQSDKVKLDAPEIAENGAVVPISISSTLPDVTSISIIVTENPFPLTASYRFPPGAQPTIGSRLKMAKTSKVIALVESGGNIYSATKEVKVTVGGCGG